MVGHARRTSQRTNALHMHKHTLHFNRTRMRTPRLCKCSAINGEGVLEGLDWLSTNLNASGKMRYVKRGG